MAVLLLSDLPSYLWFSLAGQSTPSGHKPVWEPPPATKLLTLQEAQALRRGQNSVHDVTQSSDIEVEEGPAAESGRFHTVIDFPSERPSVPSKRKESAAGSWRSCFCLGKPSPERQLQSSAREPSEAEVVVLAGELSPCVPQRSRASEDGASCASINGQLLRSTSRSSSEDSLLHDSSAGEKEVIVVQALIHTIPAEGADLSLPDATVTSQDCGLVPLQCSPAQAQPECPDSDTSEQDQVSVTEEQPSLLEGDLESGLQSQAPGSSTSSEPLSP
ncbi:rho GTPase-activating protein 32-like isoform X2 [Coturnix japonica]|uniref:rho GTPase-activating protein 32-like isoform X2 n=1 Tax=Coturnix japonica TaxID=93934 RepID=UPI000777D14A|nr:rho GTPase-activating protein 32-like isoform X2 [Coturnix japonica]